jgi:recombinational DNA repair ATPase RecF
VKLLHIRVKSYRALEELQIELPPTGVTVLEAPNEAGKSSLLEAVKILFKYPDSSKHGAVTAVQPVGRDVATEIEVSRVAEAR